MLFHTLDKVAHFVWSSIFLFFLVYFTNEYSIFIEFTDSYWMASFVCYRHRNDVNLHRKVIGDRLAELKLECDLESIPEDVNLIFLDDNIHIVQYSSGKKGLSIPERYFNNLPDNLPEGVKRIPSSEW